MPYLASDEKRVIGGSSALKSQMFLAHDAISPFSGMSRGSILFACCLRLQDVPRNIIYMLEGSLLFGGLF